MAGNVDVTLYANRSIERKLNKVLDQKWTGQAVLVSPLDDFNPTVKFTLHNSQLHWSKVNYMKVSGAYYFIESVEHLHENITLVHGRMDLLMTYRNSILGLHVVGDRSTSHGNPYIKDDERELTNQWRTIRTEFMLVDIKEGRVGWGYPHDYNKGMYMLTVSTA